MSTKLNNHYESKYSNMDRKLPPKTFVQRYKFYILGSIIFLIFLIYVFMNVLQGKKIRIDSNKIQIVEVKDAPFLDYIDSEGTILPIATIYINALESGMVERIVVEEGTLLTEGDTILILQNPELNRIIEEQLSEWEKQRIIYQEKKLEMEQKTILLKQQTLQARYELNRLQKDFNLGEEEFKMGVKSKAQLDVQREEYNYKIKNTDLQLESLKQDSASSQLRYELMKNDLERSQKYTQHVQNRIKNLVIQAPISGQLSFLNAALGQRIGQSENIGEIKVIDNFKIRTKISEYYIDRVSVGLPASITYQGEKFPLRISKVVPEVKDRYFEVDLIFTDRKPDNVRIGKSFRLQIELGQPEKAIIIPKGDFFQITGGQWIFKLNQNENKAVRVPIIIGRQNPEQYEIIDGLKPNDKVIISGYSNFGEVEYVEIK